jgi:hypothetical protein
MIPMVMGQENVIFTILFFERFSQLPNTCTRIKNQELVGKKIDTDTGGIPSISNSRYTGRWN